MSTREKLKRAVDIAGLLVDIGTAVFRAVARGDIERVEEILPDTLRTTLARAKAELDAAEKLGPRPEEP